MHHVFFEKFCVKEGDRHVEPLQGSSSRPNALIIAYKKTKKMSSLFWFPNVCGLETWSPLSIKRHLKERASNVDDF